MQHGYPARILIPGLYGMKGPKWLDSIQLVNHETGGYWEQQGWDHNPVVKTTSRFDTPRDGAILKLGSDADLRGGLPDQGSRDRRLGKRAGRARVGELPERRERLPHDPGERL